MKEVEQKPDDYITGSPEDQAEGMNAVLEKSLVDIGVDIKTVSDEEYKANALIVDKGKDVLEYYWGERLLFTTEPMQVTQGIRVSYAD